MYRIALGWTLLVTVLPGFPIVRKPPFRGLLPAILPARRYSVDNPRWARRPRPLFLSMPSSLIHDASARAVSWAANAALPNARRICGESGRDDRLGRVPLPRRAPVPVAEVHRTKAVKTRRRSQAAAPLPCDIAPRPPTTYAPRLKTSPSARCTWRVYGFRHKRFDVFTFRVGQTAAFHVVVRLRLDAPAPSPRAIARFDRRPVWKPAPPPAEGEKRAPDRFGFLASASCRATTLLRRLALVIRGGADLACQVGVDVS